MVQRTDTALLPDVMVIVSTLVMSSVRASILPLRKAFLMLVIFAIAWVSLQNLSVKLHIFLQFSSFVAFFAQWTKINRVIML